MIWRSCKDHQINLCHYYTTNMGFSPHSTQDCQFKILPTAFSEQTTKYNVCQYVFLLIRYYSNSIINNWFVVIVTQLYYMHTYKYILYIRIAVFYHRKYFKNASNGVCSLYVCDWYHMVPIFESSFACSVTACMYTVLCKNTFSVKKGAAK